MKKTWKRLLSFIMALAMMLTLLPATVLAADGDTAIYLKPNANWLVDNARFAVYYWTASGGGWIDMTAADTEGYYVADVPACTGLILCRMNPSTMDNDWTNKWNQTGDLTLPADGTNCYTVAEGTWDKGGGTWSVYGSTDSGDTDSTVSYYVAGSAGLCGVEWSNGDPTCQMTDNGDGTYSITFSNIAAGSYEFKVTDGTWDNAWPSSNYVLTLETKSDVTITFNASSKEITVSTTEVTEDPAETFYLIGYINSANYGCEEDYANLGEYKFVDGKLTATFTSDSYVFVKTGDNANWYMSEGYAASSPATLYNTSLGLTEANKLFVPAGKVLEFTLVQNDDGSLTLSYAENTSIDLTAKYYVAGTSSLCGAEWDAGNANNEMTNNGDGTYSITYTGVAAGSHQFKVTNGTWNASWPSSNYTLELFGAADVTIHFNSISKTIKVDIAYSGDISYTANIYFRKPADWGENITVSAWNDDGTIDATAEADAANIGWYNVSIARTETTGFYFSFRDGENTTDELSTGTLSYTTNIWVVDGQVLTAAPEGWVDPNRTVHVPGTFPGPSWDAASNRMSYNPALGLYVYTFEDVPAANYEFKIAINGSWSENYGAGGAFDGSNIAVTVPETMDVTVYYNDNTHYAVTNVNYVFVDITLSGTGIPADTKLTDPGLSGIYSGTVSLAAGTYSDVKITYDDKEYVFTEFTLDAAKDVTFYIDPVTGIYYCDASNVPIDTASIYYNSQDEAYKAPFGAVATGEDVTFAIDAGEDITSAMLVIKGVSSVPMEKDENGLWTATTSIANLGEYDYYFALSNGSTIAIYGDDDGYYGEGIVTDLVNVQPYDLVVYKDGFKTPDWMKDAVIYQIFPDRFFDGDASNNQAQTWARGEVDYEYITDWYTLPENPEQEALLDETTYKTSGAHYGDGEWSNEIYGGDLEGITQRIDYLKALGVNVIYLNPVFWSISNHRYDAVDYTEIDPILGTLGDFEELVATAEANDMHIILDGVFNHVSDDSIYFDRYYRFLGTSEKIGAYPYWAYVYDYMTENGATKADAETAAKTYFSENYGITDYSYTEWFAVSSTTMADTVDNVGLRAGKEVYSYEGWWGYDSMPVIYSTNGSEYQTGNWAEEIIYNEDNSSVTQYWITKGNNGWRLDVANEVSDETWQNFRNSVKALDSDAVIIGEIWDDATKYLMGDMYDSVMNYLFRNNATGFAMGTNAETTTKAMEKVRERYPEEAFYAMMNLVGSHDTTRVLSYLDGIGDDRNQKDFDSAFPTYEGTSQLAKQRQYLVSFLQFTYAGAPTIYYGDEIGMVGSDDPDDRRAFEWGKGNKELVEWYAKLAAIREAYPALRTGSVKPVDLANKNLLAYTRADANNTLIVIANNAQTAQSATLDGSYVDLISGKTFDGTVPALNGVILVAENETMTITVNTADLAPAYDPAYVVAEKTALEYVNASLTLDGTIGVNYYVNLPGYVLNNEGAYMQFTVAGQTQKVMLEDLKPQDDGSYKLTCLVNAKQMTDTVTGQMYLSDGTAVGDAKEYSVKDYCDYVLDNSDSFRATLVELVKAMLNYGAAAQVALNYNTSKLANENLPEADKLLAQPADLDSYAAVISGSEEGIKAHSASLVLESNTTIRYYFQLTGHQTIEQYEFKVNGEAVTPVESGGLYYVDMDNISAKDLDTAYTASVGGLSVTYSGLSYVYACQKYEAATGSMLNTAYALYHYNQAANAYFA